MTLLAEAIRDASHRGDVVLDVFCGSDSSLIAAAKVGRRARSIELDPLYVDVAVRRWQAWSGGTARHAATGLSFEAMAAQRAVEAACLWTRPRPPAAADPSGFPPPRPTTAAAAASEPVGLAPVRQRTRGAA